ncbi:hypothetical protein [Halalkalicoccus subterraneus]|uniref:hypothetical protein n=1 Tax=Halalkalicoccus subterraneus TaxID=2675002 RepID=UPI000EFB88A5|nr:hypothetical protein [Halalkalicoccus subterraneus]
MSDTDPETGGDSDHVADERTESDGGNRGLSDRAAFWISAVLSLALAVGSVWLIGVRAIQFEALQRVRPTVEGGGVGAGWIQGNTKPALDWLITLIHFADVLMGVFILVMIFMHWIAFRRLAARMRPHGAPRRNSDAVATDGGERSDSASDTTCGGDAE